ncbi:MAG: hypothetical protein ACPL7B_03715 [Candidatus Poribacteria bacterium]
MKVLFQRGNAKLGFSKEEYTSKVFKGSHFNIIKNIAKEYGIDDLSSLVYKSLVELAA